MRSLNPEKLYGIVYNETRKALRNPMPEGAVCSIPASVADSKTRPLQKELKDVLLKSGIPAEEIKVYGSQVMITALSHEAGKRWYLLLSKFASTVRGPKESISYNKVNTGRRLAPDSHKVWIVWGTI